MVRDHRALPPTLSAPFSVVVTAGFRHGDCPPTLRSEAHRDGRAAGRACGAHPEGLVGCKVTECDVASEPRASVTSRDERRRLCDQHRRGVPQGLHLLRTGTRPADARHCGEPQAAARQARPAAGTPSSMASVRDPRCAPCNGKYYNERGLNNLSPARGPGRSRISIPRPRASGCSGASPRAGRGCRVDEPKHDLPRRDRWPRGCCAERRDLLKVLQKDGLAQSRLICGVRDGSAHISALTAPLRTRCQRRQGGAGAGVGAGDLSNGDDGAGGSSGFVPPVRRGGLSSAPSAVSPLLPSSRRQERPGTGRALRAALVEDATATRPSARDSHRRPREDARRRPKTLLVAVVAGARAPSMHGSTWRGRRGLGKF